MTNLVIIKDEQPVTTSLQIADDFEKEHHDVIKSINKLKEDVGSFSEMFLEGIEADSYGRPRKIYFMNRDGFTLLAMGYNGKKALDFKVKYIQAFNYMEGQLVKSVSDDPWDTLSLMFAASKQTKDEVKKVKSRVINLEENTSINPGKYSYIGRRISQKVRQVGKERKWTMNKDQLALLYKDLNKAVAEVSGVKTRSQLREKHFDNVMDMIDDWEPSTATKMLIHNIVDEEAFPTEKETKR
ncbi:MAG: Rha family transcriptional regulator [Carnobacterium sp.]|uniref:Rha family transcriptional regulator n=1 Tax=Carnobacterium sp. TaxID=48221 RepID=UPI0033157111